jgi:hypothetical protein
MDEEFSEKRLHDKFWNWLTERYDGDCFARNWKGWSYRVGKKQRKKTYFYREFDVARFHREQHQYGTELWLYGYEVKGYEKRKVKSKEESTAKFKEPAFGLGIDQTLVLLYQGADFAYLVIPEPKNERNRDDLKEFCDKYAYFVGIIFLTEQGDFWEFREAQRNPSSTEGRKNKMLTSLISAGQFSDIKIPLWCKKHEY